MSNVLLIRPSYPSSRNNVYRIPIGLCKLSSYHKSLNDTVWYTEGTILDGNIPYDKIDICHIYTLFTYWSSISIETINFYKKICKNAKIVAGGIYASIAPEHLKANSMVDEIVVGIHPLAEKFMPDYDILPRDNEIINSTKIMWASRGCKRLCDQCMVWKVEPKVYFKSLDKIERELQLYPERKNVIFFDNSILQHVDIENVLKLLIEYHKKYKYKYSFCQGVDGRMMKQWEEKGIPIAELCKEAGVYDLRFSYDWSFQKESAYYCVEKFEAAGYKRKDMMVFCIINSKESPDIIEKRMWEIYSQLGTHIHSDRYRPPDWFYDYYEGSKRNQTETEYFINTEHGWSDMSIKSMLRFMSDLNFATRMGILYINVDDIQKASVLNKGKSSHKFSEYL